MKSKLVSIHIVNGSYNWQMMNVQSFDLTFKLIDVYEPTNAHKKRRLRDTLTIHIQQFFRLESNYG